MAYSTWNSLVFVLSGSPGTVRDRREEINFKTSQRQRRDDNSNKTNITTIKRHITAIPQCLTFGISSAHCEGTELIN